MDDSARPDDRRAKLARLREQGIEPFPHQFEGVTPIAEVHAAHDALEAGEETDQQYRIAGRMIARRGHGGAAFLDIVDRSGTTLYGEISPDCMRVRSAASDDSRSLDKDQWRSGGRPEELLARYRELYLRVFQEQAPAEGQEEYRWLD